LQEEGEDTVYTIYRGVAELVSFNECYKDAAHCCCPYTPENFITIRISSKIIFFR